MTGPLVLLQPHLIRQIAAGEVIERPSSVIKELVENALDAGATSLTVTWRHGGQSVMKVEDNGQGMTREELELAIQRHTTSKLGHGNLQNITTLGFRGEALSSITSVSRVTLKSRVRGSDHGWSLTVEGGTVISCEPVACPLGTSIEVRDLFFATPARLKFMRSENVEHHHISLTLDKIALCHDHVTLITSHGLYHQGKKERLKACLGEEFLSHEEEILWEKEGYHLAGSIGRPSLHRASLDHFFFFVNRRPVRDKLLTVCIKNAFLASLPSGRYPVGVLFLTLPPEELDVNVHPAKTEVRFRDPRMVRSFVSKALSSGSKALLCETTHSHEGVAMAQQGPLIPQKEILQRETLFNPLPFSSFPALREEASFIHQGTPFIYERLSLVEKSERPLDLGKVMGQINNTYIVASNKDGLILVDPHAAHERLMYEKMKLEWKDALCQKAPLLIQVSVSLTPCQCQVLHLHQEVLSSFGFDYVVKDQVCELKAVPSLFSAYEACDVIQDMASCFSEEAKDPSCLWQEWTHHIMANWACRQSIKLGQSLSFEEMDALLRLIEKTPGSGQCTHGRPVYHQWPFSFMEKIFERR